jgi:hypothetical protein
VHHQEGSGNNTAPWAHWRVPGVSVVRQHSGGELHWRVPGTGAAGPRELLGVSFGLIQGVDAQNPVTVPSPIVSMSFVDFSDSSVVFW